MSKPKLWHCNNTRSLRPLWALEEMELDYDLELMPFPPRIYQKDFLDKNALGTVPYFEDGTTTMTESIGICHYLAERYRKTELSVAVDHPEYGDYLNWLYHSDATLTFPQTIVMRYHNLEPEERKLHQAIKDYGKWYIARLRKLDAQLSDREFLCDSHFTIADISVTYALYFGELLGLSEYYSPQVLNYLSSMKQRPAFKRAAQIGKDLDPFKNFPPTKFHLFD